MIESGKVFFHCHLFCVEEIEFDIDPREVSGDAEWQAVADFMRFLAKTCSKPAILCPENVPDHALVRCDPETGALNLE